MITIITTINKNLVLLKNKHQILLETANMKPHYLTQSIRVGLLLSATLATTTYAEQSVNNTDANNTEKTIEKIMVTGQKFDRSLQETTTSVIVLTDKMMTEKID